MLSVCGLWVYERFIRLFYENIDEIYQNICCAIRFQIQKSASTKQTQGISLTPKRYTDLVSSFEWTKSYSVFLILTVSDEIDCGILRNQFCLLYTSQFKCGSVCVYLRVRSKTEKKQCTEIRTDRILIKIQISKYNDEFVIWWKSLTFWISLYVMNLT